jgi:hypothetical protein
MRGVGTPAPATACELDLFCTIPAALPQIEPADDLVESKADGSRGGSSQGTSGDFHYRVFARVRTGFFTQRSSLLPWVLGRDSPGCRPTTSRRLILYRGPWAKSAHASHCSHAAWGAL